MDYCLSRALNCRFSSKHAGLLLHLVWPCCPFRSHLLFSICFQNRQSGPHGIKVYYTGFCSVLGQVELIYKRLDFTKRLSVSKSQVTGLNSQSFLHCCNYICTYLSLLAWFTAPCVITLMPSCATWQVHGVSTLKKKHTINNDSTADYITVFSRL